MTVTLVTGATGFIGSHLVESLAAEGQEIRCLVRPGSNLRWLPQGAVRLFTTPSALEGFAEAMRGVEVVYHLAGATKARSLAEYQHHNVTLTRRLLDAVAAHAPGLRRFVMVSSQAAAGPGAPGQVPDESVVCRPLTHYGESKLSAERLLALYPGIPGVILRPVSVYGPRDRDVLGLIKGFDRGFAPVIGSLDRRLTFVFVEDLVRALRLAAESPAAVGQTYFVSDGQVYTWREVLAVMKRVLGHSAWAVQVPAPVVWTLAAVSELVSRLIRRPTIFNFNKVREILEQNWSCTSGKLQAELGFTPGVGLEDGLRRTVAWARQAGWM